MAIIIATQTAAAASADFTLADGVSSRVNILDAEEAEEESDRVTAELFIEAKDASGLYYRVATLDSKVPALRVLGPGTYRVSKPETALAYGAERV